MCTGMGKTLLVGNVPPGVLDVWYISPSPSVLSGISCIMASWVVTATVCSGCSSPGTGSSIYNHLLETFKGLKDAFPGSLFSDPDILHG